MEGDGGEEERGDEVERRRRRGVILMKGEGKMGGKGEKRMEG